MNLKGLVLTNTLYQLLSKFVSTFSTFVVVLIITRTLGPTIWGKYSIALAYIFIFLLFTEFGLNSIAARDFSIKKHIETKDFYNFFIVRLIFTITAILVSIIALQFLNYAPEIKKAIYIGQISLFLFSISSSFNALFQAKLSYKYYFYITLIFALTHVSLFVLLISNYNHTIYYLFVPMVIADFVRAFAAFMFSKKIITKGSFVLNKNHIKYFLITAIPLGLALVFNTLMTQVDKIMLSKMVDPVQNGYYNLSYKLFDILLVVPTFFMNASFPILYQKYKKASGYGKELTLSIYVLGILSILTSCLGLLFGRFFIPLFGSQMYPAVYSFNILVAGAFFFYVSSPISWAFVVENKQKILIYVYSAGLVLNVLLNLFAISKYNYLGAAITTIITEVFILIALEVLRRRYLKVAYTFVSLHDLVSLKNIWSKK